MIFDKLCKVIESGGQYFRDYHADLLQQMRKAAIFRFDGDPVDVLPKVWTPEEISLAKSFFFLPFPVVAVEDDISCVLLADIEDNQRGMNTYRRYIDAQPDPSGRNPEGIILSFGHVKVDPSPASTPNRLIQEIEGSVFGIYVFDKTRMVAALPVTGPLRDESLRNAKVAIEEVWFFNSPEHFVVEVTDVRARQSGKRSKKAPPLRRSHERPLYTLLRPREIRERFPGLASDGSHRKAHWRRRHFRLLRSDFYKAKRGQRVVVEAHWVGPTETRVGNKKYVVRTDL